LVRPLAACSGATDDGGVPGGIVLLAAPLPAGSHCCCSMSADDGAIALVHIVHLWILPPARLVGLEKTVPVA